MRIFLIALTILLASTISYAEEYYVIIDVDGTVLNVRPVKTATPNANEKKLFKIIRVDLKNTTEYYSFVNSVLAPSIKYNLDGSFEILANYINKIDTSAIVGKSEKVLLNVVTQKIVPMSKKKSAVPLVVVFGK